MAQIERQVCYKCGREFASTQVDATTFHSFGRIERIVDKKICPDCGGTLLWVDENGMPLDREWAVKHHFKMAALWAIPVLIGIGLLVLIRSCSG